MSSSESRILGKAQVLSFTARILGARNGARPGRLEHVFDSRVRRIRICVRILAIGAVRHSGGRNPLARRVRSLTPRKSLTVAQRSHSAGSVSQYHTHGKPCQDP